MKLVDIEFEHSSNQITIQALKNEFISAINENYSELIIDLEKIVYSRFLETGIHKIFPRLTAKQEKLNSGIMLNFLENFNHGWCVCKFDIIQDVSSKENSEGTTVSLSTTQHYLHSVCKKWAEKLTKHYYLINPEVKNLYDMTIVKYYPPCFWMYSFWNSISSWMKKYNLEEIDKNEKWFFESIVYTVEYWSKNPSEIESVRLLQSELYHKDYLKTLKPPINLREWQPQFKEREKYLEEVKEEAKKKLEKVDIFENRKILKSTLNEINIEIEKYCDEVEKYFRSHGWKKITVKKEYKKHIEWAIRFQIKKESFSSIAREYNVYPSSVKKETESILKLIGLKKREVKRGRKKGQKTSETAKILKELGK